MSAPTLPELLRVLQAAYEAYPQLRRGLTAAVVEVERAQHLPTSTTPRRDRRAAAATAESSATEGCNPVLYSP